MGAIEDILLNHSIVKQLVQSLKQQGFDTHLDICNGYLTLTVRLFAIDAPSLNAIKDSSIDSESLQRKKKFMQSLLGQRRYFSDAKFLTPDDGPSSR